MWKSIQHQQSHPDTQQISWELKNLTQIKPAKFMSQLPESQSHPGWEGPARSSAVPQHHLHHPQTTSQGPHPENFWTLIRMVTPPPSLATHSNAWPIYSSAWALPSREFFFPPNIWFEHPLVSQCYRTAGGEVPVSSPAITDVEISKPQAEET